MQMKMNRQYTHPYTTLQRKYTLRAVRYKISVIHSGDHKFVYFIFIVTNSQAFTANFIRKIIISCLCSKQVIIIHSSDTDGRAILGRFQTTSQTNYDDVDVRATVESIVEFEPKLETFMDHLAEMKTAQSRVYLLYARLVFLFSL